MSIAATPNPGPAAAMVRPEFAGWVRRIVAAAKRPGLYAAIELLLPGGSLIVLLLWLYQRYARTRADRRAPSGYHAGADAAGTAA